MGMIRSVDKQTGSLLRCTDSVHMYICTVCDNITLSFRFVSFRKNSTITLYCHIPYIPAVV